MSTTKIIETEDDLEIAKHKDFKKTALNGLHKKECNCGYCTLRSDLNV